MADKTLPPPKRPGDSSAAARGIKPGPPIDQTSVTLERFEPVPKPETAAPVATDAAHNAETIQYTPPASTVSPPPIPSDETHPRAYDATIAGQPADGATLGPGSLLSDQTLPPGMSAGSDQTLAAGPDMTLGGGLDAATQAFHKAAMASAPKAITTGATFGHYELISPIAKGGMGIVYKARQRNLNRIVAIKMILAGQFADQSDIDRFYAEAEAAAALSHPNIVAIHEIGEVSGQHFFSMDYIEGQSLAGLIQENPVPPRRAAEFARTIAETMQFAHDSGVVHRDLKPANVLLDKRQRPLITDFGLAKQVSNTSQLTMAGSIVGTPSYMPPEQAAGKIDEVGPWSDLYSIGAILYELLTGRPPFRAASPFETIRQVLEQEPPSPRLLNPALPRDLETICLKCLQKERIRRYESAQELADELGRFLRGEPIHARPISQAARFWSLCKRYPITSSAIGLAAVFFVGASIISTIAYFRTAAALAQAEISFREANEVVDKFLTTVADQKLANLPGGQPIQKELLDEALVHNERFLKQRANDPRVANELARSHFRVGKISMTLGRYDDALTPLLAARQMQAELLAKQPNDEKKLKVLSDTLTELGQIYVRKNDLDQAAKAYAEAATIRGRLAKAVPDNKEYQRLHASSHMNAGLAAYNMAQMNPGDPQYQSKLNEARTQYAEAQRIREVLRQNEPDNPKVLRDLGKGHFNLGNLADLEGFTPVAIGHYKDAAKLFEDVLAIEPKDLDNQGNLTNCYRLVAALSKDQPAVARKQYKEALEKIDKLVRQNPEVAEFQAHQGGLLFSLFELEKQDGRTSEAREALERAKKIYVPLVERFPEIPTYQRDLAITLRELAKEESAAGDGETAAVDLGESIRLLTSLVGQFPDEVELADRLKETQEIVLTKAPE